MRKMDFYPNSTPAGPNTQYGLFTDESVAGAQDGVDIISVHMQDLYYSLYQVFLAAGITPNDILENGTTNTQFFDALTELFVDKSFVGTGKGNIKAGYLPQNGLNEFKAIEKATPGQSVIIEDSTGIFYGSDAGIFVGSAPDTEVTLTTADATNPRWDLVSLDASATNYIVTIGIAAANPIQPSIPANQDGICYVYRRATINTVYQRDILDIRNALTVKNTNGHFKTNFSIDQKEDTENSQCDTQQMFQMLPFETKFDSLQPDKTFLHNVDTVLVPIFSHEISESGAWSNIDTSNYLFGRGRLSSTAGDTIQLAFTGVSCAVALETDNNCGDILVELSKDGGATWGDKKLFTTRENAVSYDVVFNLYSGLDYGDYVVRITVARSVQVAVSYFSYTTYMNQRSITQYALASGGPSGIDDVPPTTTLLNGTWGAKNVLHANAWNGTHHNATVAGDYAEFKFYGSACWVNLRWTINTDVTVTPLIDGSSTKVKELAFNTDTPSNDVPSWIRLDDGTLDEGWHIIRITATTIITGGDDMYLCGFGYYSEKIPTTIAKSLICGKGGYIESADSSNFSYIGTWPGIGDVASALLQRQNINTTINDYVSITTPNNVKLKAIYLVVGIKQTIGAELKITLAAGQTRYITLNSNNYDQNNGIFLLYDSFLDSALHNKVLKIENNDGNNFLFEGIIWEIGETVENDYLFCMPKWTRYNNSTVINTCVSTSHRLDVYGAKTDAKEGRKPTVHSGWVVGGSPFWKNGLGIVDTDVANVVAYNTNGAQAISAQVRKMDAVIDVVAGRQMGVSRLSHVSIWWFKLALTPNRVI